MKPDLNRGTALSAATGLVTEPLLTLEIQGEEFFFQGGYRRHGFIDSVRNK